MLGIISYQLKNYDSAIQFMRKVINLNPTDAQAYYILGHSLQEKGEIDEAITHYQKSLRLNPNIADAYYNLGTIFQDKKQYDEAISCYHKSLEFNPNDIDAYYNLGRVLEEKEEFDKAITCYQKALQLNPNLADAYNNIGVILKEKEQLDEAITYFQKALQLNPNLADAYNNIGVILKEKEQPDEAITYFQKALELSPGFYKAYHNIGGILQKKGQFDEAITYFQKALELNPNDDKVLMGLGSALCGKGQLDEAITYFQKALKLNPNDDKAHLGLGSVFHEKGQLDEAIACFQKAIQLNPNYVDSYYNMGHALIQQGRQDEAITHYNKALNLNPHCVKALWARGMSQLPIIYINTESIQLYRKRYYDELLNLISSVPLETQEDIEVAADAVGCRQPFYLAYQGFNDHDLQELYGNLVCKIMTLKYPELANRPIMTSVSSEDPIRVGIISGYFYRHPVWKMLIRGWIKNLNKEHFRLYGYYTRKKKDDHTEVARQYFSKFVEDLFSFEQLCKVIRNDDLHVIIYPEIGMDPTTIRLAALRLAPIQCASWGHPVTSGLPSIDYFLTGDLLEPPDADNHYTERLIRLSNLSVYYSPLEISPVDVERNMFGLRPNSVVYHCCQTPYKYLPEYDDVYPLIAQEVIDCQFLFSSYQYGNSVTEQFRLRIRNVFNRFHLNADDYLVFLPFVDEKLYNATYKLSNVFLDPIGWSGCNSVFEALHFDLPVVTCPSSFMRGREGSAILKMMKVIETIAQTKDDYVALAIKLGKDLHFRQQIKNKILSKQTFSISGSKMYCSP